MSQSPYQTTPEQLAIAIGYSNNDHIADQVMPIVSARKKNFEYNEFDKRDGYQLPDAQVGRKSELKVMSFGSKKVAAACQDYGLKDYIPNDDEAQAAGDNLPKQINRSTEKLTSIVKRIREKRVADLAGNADNFDISATPNAASKFDNADYKPIKPLLELMDGPLIRPNTWVFGQAAWQAFRTNPAIVKAAHGNDGDSGAASRQAVMDLFEIQNLLVGTSFVDTAKPGKAASFERAWGPNLAMLHIGEIFAAEDEALTWGFTAQYGEWVTGYRDAPQIGLRGATEVKSGQTVAEVVAAKGAGVLLTDVLGG